LHFINGSNFQADKLALLASILLSADVSPTYSSGLPQAMFFKPGLPGSHKQKRPDQPLKKANSTEKSQIRDKYITTPLKHPNALLKGSIYIFYT